VWITPGSIVATTLWLLISLAFRFYLTNFGSYNATYGAIGGVIVLLLWFYLSGLAVLVGAEVNSNLEQASPYGKDPGERTLDDKPAIGEAPDAPAVAPAPAGNCDIDRALPPASPAPVAPLRARDWVLGGLFLGQAAILAYARLRGRFERVRTP
jgi:membrane protein